MNAEHIDKVVLMLVQGIAPDAARVACIEKLGLSPDDADAVIAQARKNITIAAEFNRAKELGTAIIRLNDLYTRCIRLQDTKTALAAQKEISKMLQLHQSPTADPGGDAEDETLDASAYGSSANALRAVREHLAPLALAGDETPTPELARLAVERIVELMGSKNE